MSGSRSAVPSRGVQSPALPAVLPLAVLGLLICYLLTSVPASVIRLLRSDSTVIWASQVFKLALAPMIALSCIGVFALLVKRALRVDGLSLVLIAFGYSSVLTGLASFYRGTNLATHAFNHVASLLMMVSMYLLALNLPDLNPAAWGRVLDLYCGTSIVVYGLSLVFFVFARTGAVGAGYWGFGVDVLLAVTWFAASNRPVASVAASALILLNGKRMYTIGWIVAIIVLIAHARRSRGWRWLGDRAVIALFFFGLALMAVVVSLSAGIVSVPAFIMETTDKWRLLLGLNGSFGFDRASAGRLTDAFRAWHFLQEDPVRWFVGGGVGLWWPDYGAEYNISLVGWQTHYTHFSFLNFVTLGGLPLAVVVMASAVWRLVQTWRRLPSSPAKSRPMTIALLAFVSARLVEGFFANIYFSDPSLWLAFGLLGSVGTAEAPQQRDPPT